MSAPKRTPMLPYDVNIALHEAGLLKYVQDWLGKREARIEELERTMGVVANDLRDTRTSNKALLSETRALAEDAEIRYQEACASKQAMRLQRDEAVALLRRWTDTCIHKGDCSHADARAFLARIDGGGK